MKTKGFLTAAAISVALAFTFTGCSDDDGNEGGGTLACKQTRGLENSLNGKKQAEICREFPASILEEEGMTMNDFRGDCGERRGNPGDSDYKAGGTVSDTCPGGHVLECPRSSYTIYVYDNEFKDVTCSQFLDAY
jgi:hypothetical protein